VHYDVCTVGICVKTKYIVKCAELALAGLRCALFESIKACAPRGMFPMPFNAFIIAMSPIEAQRCAVIGSQESSPHSLPQISVSG
jgi:hypothetical protein